MVATNHHIGLARWLSGERYLLPSPTTWVRSLKPTWWVERPDSQTLSCYIHICAMVYIHSPHFSHSKQLGFVFNGHITTKAQEPWGVCQRFLQELEETKFKFKTMWLQSQGDPALCSEFWEMLMKRGRAKCVSGPCLSTYQRNHLAVLRSGFHLQGSNYTR